jgi:hypothetical protein
MSTRRHEGLPPSVGEPLNRVDGRLKVTGAARYAAGFAYSTGEGDGIAPQVPGARRHGAAD